MADTAPLLTTSPRPKNQFAMAVGLGLQRSVCQVGLAVVSLGAAGYGVLHLAAAPSTDIASGGLIGVATTTLLLTWVVRHSPFDLVNRLEGTVQTFERTGTLLQGSTERLQAQVDSLASEKSALERARTMMTQELEQSALVRRGMQQTLNTLLADVGARNTELQTLTAAVTREITELGQATDNSNNRFLAAITGLDEHIQRAARLTTQLTAISRSNTELSKRMVMLTRKLEDALAELQDTRFADTMERLLLELDALGDAGMRSRLQAGAALPADETAQLAELLTRLDTQLRAELTHKKQRCAAMATETRQIVDDSLGSVFID